MEKVVTSKSGKVIGSVTKRAGLKESLGFDYPQSLVKKEKEADGEDIVGGCDEPYIKEAKSENLKKVGSTEKYDFYRGMDSGRPIWNIVPTGAEAPAGGYPNRAHIEKVKGVKFPSIKESVGDEIKAGDVIQTSKGPRTVKRINDISAVSVRIATDQNEILIMRKDAVQKLGSEEEEIVKLDRPAWDKAVAANPNLSTGAVEYTRQVVQGEEGDFDIEPQHKKLIADYRRFKKEGSVKESGSLIGAESPSQCNSSGMFECLLHVTKGAKLSECKLNESVVKQVPFTSEEISKARSIGDLEVEDKDGKEGGLYHVVLVKRGDTKYLVVGSPTNNTFLIDGWMEVDFSVDETLQDLVADLEMLRDEGPQYVSGAFHMRGDNPEVMEESVVVDRNVGYTVWSRDNKHKDVNAKTREEAKEKGAKLFGTTVDQIRAELIDTNPRGKKTPVKESTEDLEDQAKKDLAAGKMLVFKGGIDVRSRVPSKPTVAKLDDKYIVIGTQYGFIHTTGGDIKTWDTAAGARAAILKYSPL